MSRIFLNSYGGDIKLFEDDDEHGKHGTVYLTFSIDFERKEVSFWYKFRYRISDHTYGECEYSLTKCSLDKFIETCKELIKEICDGYVRCSYCGKLVAIKDAHWCAPAGCACDDCYEEAHKESQEFLSMLD